VRRAVAEVDLGRDEREAVQPVGMAFFMVFGALCNCNTLIDRVFMLVDVRVGFRGYPAYPAVPVISD
jgi:hypothetical protein